MFSKTLLVIAVVMTSTSALPTNTSIRGTDCATQICPSCGEGEEELFEFGKCCPDCVPAGCSAMECPLPKCLEGHILVRRQGECCQTCTLDCRAALCPDIVCNDGFKLVTPEGQCCSRCISAVPDCSAVSCLRPVCEEGEELVVPQGECCPQCQPVCTIKGQTFSTCASRCPRTCSSPPLFCPAVCVEGCKCPSGQVIDTVNNRCVPEDECPSIDPCDTCPKGTICEKQVNPCLIPPCPVSVTCRDPVPVDPCATVRCANGYQCEVFKPTGEAFCQPNCSLNNGGCPANQECQIQPVFCVRAPCPPVIECVERTTECPPTCSKEFCSKKANRKAMCSNPGPREIPGCTGSCQLTYCHACYYDEEPCSLPEYCPECEDLQDYLTDSRCFRRWANCIKRNQWNFGRQAERTEENFKCYNPPCPLHG